jgi:hypothetical protein
MMFDPEKVRNYTLSGIQREPVNQHYVKASDYDRLLVLYRKSRASLDAIIGIRHKTEGGDWDEIEEAQRIALAARA